MSNLIHELESGFVRENPLPAFRVGDTVDVHVRIREGEKERVQIFTGTVIKVQGGRGLRGTFTVRRIVGGEGVERTFPFHSPLVQDVRVRRKGKARRSRLFYLRDRVGKATRVKERRDDRGEKPAKGKARRAKDVVIDTDEEERIVRDPRPVKNKGTATEASETAATVG